MVNIDPGYLLRERFVSGVREKFCPPDLYRPSDLRGFDPYFSKGAFQSLPWTYPDYQAADMRSFFSAGHEINTSKI
ncbi:MAG: hypothetical protein R2874_08275 [Desulfobacterales bacterium]